MTIFSETFNIAKEQFGKAIGCSMFQVTSKSRQFHQKACCFIPGGVNSPVRAFKHVNNVPRIIKRSFDCYLEDLDGNTYIDYMSAWGAIILGHNHPTIRQAIATALEKGICYGATSEYELLLSELICNLMPSIEMLRLVNSGTEATMSAIRLARGFTGKTKIIKFSGCYHGHADQLLVKAGSGAMTLNLPDSKGVPQEAVIHTLIAPYNDIAAVAALFAKHSSDIAAVIIEPIAGNMNMVLPKANFLAELRELCNKHHSLLIFDEVMTGFRVALGGASSIYNISPDLTCLGKVIGGGMPIGAFGGRRDIMEHLAPLGSVYQAGTASGHPLAVAAGFAAIKYLQENPASYTKMANYCDNMLQALKDSAAALGITIATRYQGGMFGFNFVNDSTNKIFKAFHKNMLEQCIYLAPSAYEAGFVNLSHDDNALTKTKAAFNTVLQTLVAQKEFAF